MQLRPEWPSSAGVPQPPQHPCQLLLTPSRIMLEAVPPDCLWLSKQQRKAFNFRSSCLYSLSMGIWFLWCAWGWSQNFVNTGKHSAIWCTFLPAPCPSSLTHSVQSGPGHRNTGATVTYSFYRTVYIHLPLKKIPLKDLIEPQSTQNSFDCCVNEHVPFSLCSLWGHEVFLSIHRHFVWNIWAMKPRRC